MFDKITDAIAEWAVTAICQNPARVVLGVGAVILVILTASAVQSYLRGRYGNEPINRPPNINGWLAVLDPFCLNFGRILNFILSKFGLAVNTNPPLVTPVKDDH